MGSWSRGRAWQLCHGRDCSFRVGGRQLAARSSNSAGASGRVSQARRRTGMAKKLKVGDVIRRYEVFKIFGPGMMAISYGAIAPDGRKVFLKQYKSPAPSVVWYPSFVNYQH